MRLVIDKYQILTDKKIKKPLKVILISDVHVGDSFLMSGKSNLYSTLKGIKKVKNIDLFVFCGDFVNSAKSYLNPYVFKGLEKFITELSKIAPVILTRGNHDIFMKSQKTENKYQELAKNQNVFLLDNAQMDFLGIKITGFVPSHKTYELSKHGKSAQKLAAAEFRKENFYFDKNDFNLILTHSPYTLMNEVVMEKFPKVFENCDVILSGHLHNGLLPSGNLEFINKKINFAKPVSKIKKFIAKNIDAGIWFGAKTGFMISHCRGAKFVSENKISYPILPSSKKFIKIDLTKNKNQLVQIIGKSINKYSFLPIIHGRPSIVELKISPKNK